jgi:hypothetical protein
MRTLVALLILAVSASCGLAQDPPLAPIPSQIIAGKKAFISNASGESAVAAGVPDLTYNEFYAAMKSWGRFELVGAPTEADVVFEIRYQLSVGPVSVLGGTGGSSGGEQFRVRILDPKTHIVLWAFTEPIQGAHRRKNFDQALANLVNDIRNIAGKSATAGTSGQK